MEGAIGPDGTILMQSGGKIGVLRAGHQRLPEKALDRFPDHTLLQLPLFVSRTK